LNAWRWFKDSKKIFYVLIPYFCLCLLTCLYFLHPSNDAWYMVSFWGLRLSYILYSLLIVAFFKFWFNWTPYDFFFSIIIAFIVHASLAWVGFFFPEVRDFYFGIQHLSQVA